jgi:nitronate monooxygenase
MAQSIGPGLRQKWRRAASLPGGKWLFSRLVGLRAPCSGTLGAQVVEEVPLICGAMYPCSNPELVAAVSAAGGIGVVQPLSLACVHGYDFREGLRYIRRPTDKPVGVNLIIERRSKRYLERVHAWLDIALEERVPFLVTALGKPDRVVERAAWAGVTV